jgi:hypothetical protein
VADTPSLLKRLSDSATRCVTRRRHDERRQRDRHHWNESSDDDTDDLLLFSPSQKQSVDEDVVRTGRLFFRT